MEHVRMPAEHMPQAHTGVLAACVPHPMPCVALTGASIEAVMNRNECSQQSQAKPPATAAPASASACAQALPMPWPAPVSQSVVYRVCCVLTCAAE